jgi:hypothetical protein
MGQVRDFTDEAREQMAAILRRLSQQHYGAQSIASAMDWAVNCAINCDYDRYRGIKDYYSTLSDQNLLAADALGRVFEEVCRIDSAYAAKVSSQIQVAQGLKQSLAALTDIIGPSQTGGLPLLAQGGPELDKALRLANEGLFQAIWELFVNIGEDGSLVYDWDAIDKVLGNDADMISEAEYYVLALLYANMGDEDTITFLSILADKVEDVSWVSTDAVTHVPDEYTVWSYDPEKVGRLQDYVLLFTLAYTDGVNEIMSYDEDQMSEFYFTLFHDQIGTDVTYSEQKYNLTLLTDEQRTHLIRQFTLLTIIEGLSLTPEANERSDANPYLALSGVKYHEYGNLTGPAGATGPLLSLSENGDEYQLTFRNTLIVQDATGIGYTETYNHNNLNTVSVSNVLSGASAVAYINSHDKDYFGYRFSYGIDDLGFDAVRFASSFLAGTAGSASPVAISTIAILDFGIGTLEGMSESHQNLLEYQDHASAVDSANYCNYFRLDLLIVTGKTAYHDVIVAPGLQTEGCIRRLNELIQLNNINISDYGFSGEMTLIDIMNHPEDVQQLIDDNCSETDIRYIMGDFEGK